MRDLARVLLWAVPITVGLNALFFLVQWSTASLPTDRLAGAVREAFAEGSLSRVNRLPYDSDIGWHQYNDCLILQMVANDDRPLRKALGPVAYYDGNFAGLCATVADLFYGEITAAELDVFRYTRYWHGHNALAAAMLSVSELSTVRTILKASAYLSLLLLLFVATQAPPGLRLAGVTFGGFGLLFWGLPYFAQSLSHGPSDTTLVLCMAALVYAGRHDLSLRRFSMLCAGIGAVLVYMEFLIGLLPTAGALLVPLGYLMSGSPARESPMDLRSRWAFTLSGCLAFGLGAVLTVSIKQLLAIGLFGTEAIAAFTNNFQVYVRMPDDFDRGRLLSAMLTVRYSIGSWGRMLTFGSQPLAMVLFGASAVAWLTATVLAFRSRRREDLSLWLACVVGAAAIFFWTLLFPSHTYIHPYMVRIMIAPIALGWIVLFLQWPVFRRVQ